jgi:hypothetical protein
MELLATGEDGTAFGSQERDRQQQRDRRSGQRKRCSRPPFMREAGIVQTARSRSISSQVAPRTSPERAPVKIANMSAAAR